MVFSMNSKYLTPSLHIIIWSIILCLPLLLTNPYNNAFPLTFNLIVGVIHLGLFYGNAFFLYPKLMTRKLWWAYALSLMLLVMVTFNLKYFILKIGFPKTPYTKEMNFMLGLPILLFLVASIIYRVAKNSINYEKTLKQKEAEQLGTELKFLRSQISPHFLFNVLNNMVSMARHKSDQLEPSLIRLAGLMRYMLYESDAKKVLLTQEIDYLKNYIALQKLRFGEDVEIKVNLQCENETLTIEPMLLIPFVENAFKHGVALVVHPFIDIRLNINGNTLCFSVENKFSKDMGQSKDKDSGIGLTNIKTRLELLYPQRHSLTISSQNGIFKINLKIPLL